MDEFAMGSSTENSALGVTRNPAALDRIPGGSSGGSASSVAGGIALAALGSDTGGSIRQPAALCGCVGMKPTYGRVSRFGLIAFASSLDQIGPITRSVADAALLTNHLCGFDPRDSTSLKESVPDFTAVLGRDIKGLRIGLPKEYFIDGLHPDVEASVRKGIAKLEALGAHIEEISLPHTEAGVATYYVLAPAEASANLARFDGVRYGHRSASANDLMEHYLKSRSEGFGPEVKRRILLGTYVLSSGYYDAYYLQAQKARTLIRDDFTKAFEKVDGIVHFPIIDVYIARLDQLSPIRLKSGTWDHQAGSCIQVQGGSFSGVDFNGTAFWFNTCQGRVDIRLLSKIRIGNRKGLSWRRQVIERTNDE
jgi:aspartyl-tRNA(Asn)/glutamyl-tRNA(Gln) amidotransferase subunit A